MAYTSTRDCKQTYIDSNFKLENLNNMTVLRQKSSSFSAYNVLPTGYIAEIDPDEKTILMLRAHPFTQASWIINTILGFVLLMIFDIFLSSYLTLGVTIKINIIVIALLFGYAWHNFLIWYYTIGFVTNKRLIDVDYYGIVKRVVSQAPMAKLSDVTAKVSGFFGQIFNYGNVYVATEGTAQNIEYLNVPYPDETVAIINDAGTLAIDPSQV